MARSLPSNVVVPVLLLALVVPFSGCKKGEAVAPPPPELRVVAVEQRNVPIYAESVGTLEGDVNATISAQVTGYIVSRNYTEGTLVTNGQVLFQIDDRTYNATLDQALAKLGKSQMDVERYTPLAKTQAISQQELDDAIQANLANEAAVESARLNCNFCKVTSPIDGIAGLAQAQVGDLVGPGTGALTTVATVEPIRVYFSVSQQLMIQLMEERQKRTAATGETPDKGAPLDLTLANGSVYPHKGRVRFSNNQVNVLTGTIRVVGEFPNPDRLLVPGMFVRVRAQIGENENALLVPQIAVADYQGRNLVAVVGADNKVSMRPVLKVAQVGELCQVAGNLKPGDKVVAEGLQKVREGLEIKPVPYDPAAKPQTLTAP